MEQYSIGDIWWVDFPYEDGEKEKHRPAIIIDADTIAIIAMYVTSQDKLRPLDIEISDWKEAGLPRPSWARIDKTVSIAEWRLLGKTGHLSDADLIKVAQLFAEYQTGVQHEFSLLAIKNSENKFLQVYDERWNCWLFPYLRSTDDNKENVDKKASDLLNTDVNTTYVSVTKHCKFSASDQVYKIYNHKLYSAVIGDSERANADEFEVDGQKYRWMSFAEMEADSKTMENNEEVIAFVKSKIKLLQ